MWTDSIVFLDRSIGLKSSIEAAVVQAVLPSRNKAISRAVSKRRTDGDKLAGRRYKSCIQIYGSNGRLSFDRGATICGPVIGQWSKGWR